MRNLTQHCMIAAREVKWTGIVGIPASKKDRRDGE